jgi:hypothetical protein
VSAAPLIEIRDPLHRLINSRFPTVGLFDDEADTEEEARILFALEQMTNPRLNPTIVTQNDPVSRLSLLPTGGVVTGHTANMVMAAFVHSSDDGGRFNDGRLGAWYCASDVETAIDETVHHIGRRLALSEAGFPNTIQMRELISFVDAPAMDICGQRDHRPDLYNLGDYSASQTFANSIRYPFSDQNIAALRYNSVRRTGGINVCVFSPTALRLPVVQGDHYEYRWDANGGVSVLKLTLVR